VSLKKLINSCGEDELSLQERVVALVGLWPLLQLIMVQKLFYWRVTA
jgi:hypothetical protein